MRIFHLLVSGIGWSTRGDWLPRSRVFEYTDGEIAQQFKRNGKLLGEQIRKIPALFMSELDGSGSQFAQIGYIYHVRSDDHKVYIEYGTDPALPPISNEKLFDLKEELEIDRWQFSRTHWAIININLFEVLLRKQIYRRPRPKVFTLDENNEINNDLVSVMMPFDAGFDDVYEALKRSTKEMDLECLRADDIWEHPKIIQDVVSLIQRSRVVICDCTGRNPNVFYEIGIAHTLGKDVILITQNEGDIPFDLRHLRYLKYLNNREGMEELSERLKSRVETIIQEPIANEWS